MSNLSHIRSGPAHATVCGLALLVAGLFTSCSHKGADAAGSKPIRGTAAVPVVVGRAEAKDIPVELRNIGNVEAYSTVTIRSRITGQITKVHFREGQPVKAGDLLFTIDPRPSEAALRQAEAGLQRDEAQLVSARLEFDREKKLLENKIASRDDYDKAEAAYQALAATVLEDHANITNAQLNLEFCFIRSPVDGFSGNLMVKEGNVVKAPDDSLVTINQVHPIYVTFSVPEQDLPSIRRRMHEETLTVLAELPGDGGDSPRGELSFVDNTVDAGTARIKLKATFPNADNALWPGQFVQVTLTLDTLKQATVVPSEAIQSSQSGDFVFVVKSDATVEKRPVSVGIAEGGRTVIERGVSPGETIVTDGQLRLAEGSKVTLQAPGGTASAADARPGGAQ
jgi:multidrug efflux system membrane fusion protein